jgi:hypothetical protein
VELELAVQAASFAVNGQKPIAANYDLKGLPHPQSLGSFVHVRRLPPVVKKSCLSNLLIPVIFANVLLQRRNWWAVWLDDNFTNCMLARWRRPPLPDAIATAAVFTSFCAGGKGTSPKPLHFVAGRKMAALTVQHSGGRLLTILDGAKAHPEGDVRLTDHQSKARPSVSFQRMV